MNDVSDNTTIKKNIPLKDIFCVETNTESCVVLSVSPQPAQTTNLTVMMLATDVLFGDERYIRVHKVQDPHFPHISLIMDIIYDTGNGFGRRTTVNFNKYAQAIVNCIEKDFNIPIINRAKMRQRKES